MITLRTCLLTSLIFTSPCIYAEYYLVYPAPYYVDCINCNARPHWKHHHAKHHHAHKKHYYRNSYSITVYYPWRVITPCYSCCTQTQSYNHDIVEFNSMPGRSGSGRYIQDNPYDTYDPDLSTGDDIYPDLNINN